MRDELMKAMLSRKSVRQYTDESLTKEEIEKIQKYIANKENLKGPFNSPIRIELVEDLKTMPVKKAPLFAVLITPIDNNGLIDAGFVFEKFILFIEMLGLNTCQIGMFNRDTVKLAEPINDSQKILLCTPIGRGKEKSSLLERTIKALIGSKKRKELDEMFFSNSSKERITDGKIREKLEYLRWAPSALNAQPWRIIIEDENAHFYIAEKEHSKIHGGLNIHTLDIGIILAHYMIAFNKTKVTICKTAPTCQGMDYLFTVEEENNKQESLK